MIYYQDVMQAIRDGVGAETVEAMIANEHACLTDSQMADLRAKLVERDEQASYRPDAACDALSRSGYDVHYASPSGTPYIARLAPDSDGADTAPGSAWDEECDELAEAVRAIVAPYGCDVSWSDDDLQIVAGERT